MPQPEGPMMAVIFLSAARRRNRLQVLLSDELFGANHVVSYPYRRALDANRTVMLTASTKSKSTSDAAHAWLCSSSYGQIAY